MQRVCVFGASGQEMAPEYFIQAKQLGGLLAKRGIGLVFGGGNTGLMGAVARGVAHRPEGRCLMADMRRTRGAGEIPIGTRLRLRVAAQEPSASVPDALVRRADLSPVSMGETPTYGG